MIRSAERDRARIFRTFDSVKHTDDGFDQYLEFVEQNKSHKKWMLKHVYRPLWEFAWADLDESIQLYRIQSRIDFGRFLQTNCLAAEHAFVSTDILASQFSDDAYVITYDNNNPPAFHIRFRFLISQFHLFNSRALFKTCLMMQAHYEMTQTAIALARCKLRDGAYPPSLDRLVPDYLPTLPRDRMDGKPLRYRPLPNGTYVLYSVGVDFKDDGGSTGAPMPGQTYNLWRGPDVVWPALADESEFPEQKQITKRRRRGDSASAPTPR
jgi:hypothetical protein